MLQSLKPVLANGNVADLNLLTTTRTSLPWSIIGFEAEYDEDVTGAVNGTLAGTGFTFSGSPTITGNLVRWNISTMVSGSFSITSIGSVDDLSANPSDSTAVNKSFTTKYGDVSGDGRITSADLARIQQLRQTNSYDIYADLDGDGDVDQLDYNIARGRMGQ